MAGSQENYQLFNLTYSANAHTISSDLNGRNTASWYKARWGSGDVFQDMSESGKDRIGESVSYNLSMYDALKSLKAGESLNRS